MLIHKAFSFPIYHLKIASVIFKTLNKNTDTKLKKKKWDQLLQNHNWNLLFLNMVIHREKLSSQRSFVI